MGPKSAVENTPAGREGVAVLNVLVEAQKEESVASAVPLVPLSVASDKVIAVAGLVVGDTVASACATAVCVRRSPNELMTTVMSMLMTIPLAIMFVTIFFILFYYL